MAIVSLSESFKCPKCEKIIDAIHVVESDQKSGYPEMECFVYVCPYCRVFLGIK